MLLKITEKIIQENVFEQKKKKPGLNLTLGQALIGLRTTGPWWPALYCVFLGPLAQFALALGPRDSKRFGRAE